MKIRITKARKEIIKLFEKIMKPINAEQIYEKLEKDYDLSTIYRNLDFFTKNNTIKSLVFSDKITYYYKSESHIHFIYCTNCKKFEKFNLCYEKEISEHIKKNLGFKVENHTLYFEGICKKCQINGEKQ